MKRIIPMLFCLPAFGGAYAGAPDTLAPPNGHIIYSPDCATGGLGALFGIVIPANPAASYQWAGPNGFTASQQSFTPPDTGWYRLIVTANNCPSEPDSIHIRYFDPPVVQIGAASPFYCPAEDSIHLSAAANSPLLFWRRLLSNGGSQYLGSGPELYFSGAQLGNLMERILVTANGAYGCEGMDTITLMRQGIVTPAAPVLDCPGDSISLTVTGAGSFLWNTGDTTATLSAVADSARLFSVTVTDARGCSTVGSQLVYIQNGAYVSLQAMPPALCQGDTAVLQAGGGAAYLWETGETGSSIVLAPESADTVGLTITTAEGCVVEKAVSVSVYPLPAAPLISCEALYEELSLHWNADAGLAYTAEFLSGPAGQWLGDSSLLFTGLSPGQEVSLELRAADSLGCRISVTFNCQAAPCMLQAVAEPVAPVCLYPGAPPVSLGAVVNGSLLPGQGWWAGPAVDSSAAVFSPAQAGPGAHQLIYRYAEGPCSTEDTLEVQVNRPLSPPMIRCERTPNSISFRWPRLLQDSLYELEVLSGQGGQFLSDTSFLVDGLLPGEAVQVRITAHGEGPCGLVEAARTCRAQDCHTSAAPLTRLICPGESVALAAPALEGASYQWAPAAGLSCDNCPNPIAGPAATTTYSVTVTDENGCIHTGSTTVGVAELPASLLPDTLRACAGQPFFLCLPGEGQYRWRGPQGALLLGPCLYLPEPGPADAGLYSIDARLPGLCRFEKEAVLTLDDSPGCGEEDDDD